jgi:hypothetical protein
VASTVCGITDPVSCLGPVIGSLVGSAVGGAAVSAWNQVCKSFADAASQLMGAFGKAFIAIPPVNLGSAGVRNVYAISLGLAAAIAALLLISQVIVTAFTHDGSALAQGLVGVGKTALACMLTLAVAGAGLEAADQLTNFIVTQTFGSVQALSAKLSTIVSWDGQMQGALLLIMAIIGILLTIVLWFELLLRNAAIAVLVATSPIAAAGQAAQATRSWWSKLASATTQLIILKPVIALVFCSGFSLLAKSTDVETLLTGMLVLLLAVIAWPVVARFFTFASTQVGGTSGLGAMLGFAAGWLTAGSSGIPAGIEPGEFSKRAETRTMAGLEGAAASANSRVTGTATASGAGVAAAGISMAQRAANSLSARMEQMAGHAGIPGANPYAQPAGYAQRPGRLGRPAPPPPNDSDSPTEQAPPAPPDGPPGGMPQHPNAPVPTQTPELHHDEIPSNPPSGEHPHES